MKSFLIVILPIVFLISCDLFEVKPAKDVKPETVYQQYNVAYSDEDGKVLCKAQFGEGGQLGATILLDGIGKVQLDEQALQENSRKYGGAFYETSLPVRTFAGAHAFIYTDINGQTYRNNFTFTRFAFNQNPPDKIEQNEDLKLSFVGIGDKELIHVSLSDTSKAGKDLDSNFIIQSQSVSIPSVYFQQMSAGPLRLDVVYEKELPLQQATKEGGRMTITCAVRSREILLVDNK